MDTSQVLPTWVEEGVLRDWDWQAELKRQGRPKAWLARATGMKPRTVYAYAYGERRAPLSWLRKVIIILGGPTA